MSWWAVAAVVAVGVFDLAALGWVGRELLADRRVAELEEFVGIRSETE